MKRNIIVILIIGCALLLGCVSTHKNKTSHKSDSTVVEKKDIAITITEAIDTSVALPGSADSTTFNESLLQSGDTVTMINHESVTEIWELPGTKKIKIRNVVKPRVIPIKINKKTEIKDKSEIETEVKKTDNHQEKETKPAIGPNITLAVGGFLFLLLLLFVIRVILKYFKIL